MLCEAFQKLHPFGKVQSYRYIGFGSTYFSDFIIFHKNLNIQNMISIEKDSFCKDRFDFNLPFKCINVMYGHSNEELPKIDWNVRTILWLDYDGVLTKEVLSDIKTSASKLVSGSLLVVSVNVEPDKYDNSIEERLEKLKERLGEERVSKEIDARQLSGWLNASVIRRVIHNEIEETLVSRNLVLNDESKFFYSQLFNFHYKDNANMLTVGGVFCDKGQEILFDQCGFRHLDFFRHGEEAYKIEVPNLTFKEIKRLDEQLPRKSGEDIALPSVPKSDVEKYEKLYRYFPTFSEANF